MTIDPLVLVAIAAAIGILYLLAKKMGWTMPRWAYILVGGIVALVFPRRKGKAEVSEAPPVQPSIEPVRKTAADILAEKAAEDQARIERASASKTPEQDLADLANTRKR